MKRHLYAATAALCLAVPGVALADTRIIDARDFTGVDVSSGIRATVTIGQAFSVTAESGRADDLSELRIGVHDGMLRAGYDWNIFQLFDFPGRDLKLTITMPSLDRVDASSGSSLVATGGTAQSFAIDASSGAAVTITGATSQTYALDSSSGAGITISGSCNTATADASSGSNVEARELDCAEASADTSSGAHVSITAHSSIAIDASSGSGVTVYGKPAVKSLDTNSGASVSFPN
jgi:hypothetical protein